MILRAAAFAVTLTVVAFAARAACGDGVMDAGEQCDDGTANGSANSCCTVACDFNGNFPDVIVGDIPTTHRWGNSNGITAYSIATTSCNLGSCWLKFILDTTEHPVIAQNMFRLKDGRFEQIGQSWLKHGLGADSDNVCSDACIPVPAGDHLGVNCSDPYSAELNGNRNYLGPKSEVNASTGTFPYPFTPGSNTTVISKRLQVHDVDLDPALNPGAKYFVESQYVAYDDATAHAGYNNASYRRVTVGAAPTYDLTLQDTIHREQPAIQAWRGIDPGVVDSTFTDADGIFFLSAKVTPLGGGVYHYEYAVQNLNSDRSGQSFSVSIPPGAVVTNLGFHDVDYHSGEPFDGTDWVATVSPTAVTWATQTYAENQNANALRWGTLYNFRFDVNEPPGVGPIVIGLFKPGAGSSTATSALSPVACAGVEGTCGNGIDEDCDGQTDCADADCCEQCAGSISLARARYRCMDTLGIALEDSDSSGAGSLAVSVASTSEPAPETRFLAENPAGSGHFSGTLPVTSAPAATGDGAISVAHGDTITVRYVDAFRCGAHDVPFEQSAQVDCHGPAITNVQVTDIQSTSAEIRWETEEPGDSRVVYGPAVPPNQVWPPDADLVTSHVVLLEGLPQCTAQFFSVGSSDGLGNSSVGDNGGTFFTFETPPEYTPIFASSDPPMPIPLGAFHPVEAEVLVRDVDVVVDVNVKVRILHPMDQALVLYLIGPDFTTVVLSSRHGAGGNYLDTIFDDEASVDISDGQSAFIGSFRPDQALSAFDGKLATGTWTLRVSDDGQPPYFTGTLEDFQLELTYPPHVCGPSLGFDSGAVSDSCTVAGAGDGNGIVDPGETVQLVAHAVNRDTVSATGVSARLSSFTPGVVVTSDSSTYPDLAPGAIAPGDVPYTLYVDSAVACGTPIVLRLDGTCNEGGWHTAFEVRVGEPAPVTSTYVDYADRPIPDLTTVKSFMSVTDTGIIQDVDVGLSISHGAPRDLDIFLVSPDGTRVELTTDNGGNFAPNYTGTIFDDEAATPITAASAPCTGRFRPESPLSVLDGTPVFGTWTLEVTDDHATFPGTQLEWSIAIERLSDYSCQACFVDPPAEVLSLGWSGSGKDTLSWSAASSAATYKLYRGLASGLPALLDSGADSCERMASSGLSSGPVLTENPAPGSFYWFLVRAENGIGAGPAGNASGGPRVVNATGACP